MIITMQWALVKQKLASKRPGHTLIMHAYIPIWITYSLWLHKYFTSMTHEKNQ